MKIDKAVLEQAFLIAAKRGMEESEADSWHFALSMKLSSGFNQVVSNAMACLAHSPKAAVETAAEIGFEVGVVYQELMAERATVASVH
jgi:hypothetical protein